MIGLSTSLSFTTKYVFALSLIALFSFAAYLNLVKLIDSQSNDVKVINISGKQRMLSQKIALFAIHYKTKSLEEMVDLMDSSHAYLLSLEMSDELKDIYFSKPVLLDEKVKAYIERGKSFLKNRDGRSLTYILTNSQPLLKDLDSAVSIYQKETEQKTQNLKNVELFIFLFISVTLLFEALFIFRPANNSVKKKTKELKSQKEYADMITEINNNAIIAVDANFNILTFNKSAQNMFGYAAEEMLHTQLLDERIIPHKYLDRHVNGLKTFMTTGEFNNKNFIFELEGQHKNKNIFPIRISFGSKTEEGSRIVVANIQDITLEKEKDSLIVEQSRFAAMGEMIGNIAHQWRQPLSSISTIATGAKLRYKNNLISDEELDETFVKIKDHTQHLSKTIDDFRDFFKQDKEIGTFEICDVVDKSIMLTEAMYKDNNINLTLRSSKSKIVVNGSSGELSQVFLNILNNAKDALKEKKIKNPVVLIEVFNEDKHMVVKIHDNAGGIPDDIKTKIFEPYFTTKHKSQGTGIGLFMSKKIITKHFNSTIEVENREFEVENEKFYGAEFSIKIKKTKI
ncbi:ATP-binding protein [Sulfurimonas sp.]|uniref:ATP-binding protein n=1 Tax=Sulfurimonas sp. TaxID=2022749 RepID=UPI0035636B79